MRVVAATNHDLRADIAEKRFREDLYYRLSMVEIQTPRLADRKEDLMLLCRHFVRKFAAQYEKPIRGLTHRAQIRLLQHSWPGNVRELENVIGHAAMLSMSESIEWRICPTIPEHRRRAGPTGVPTDVPTDGDGAPARACARRHRHFGGAGTDAADQRPGGRGRQSI